MSSEKEIVFELWRLQERRCYFLMSSAGAGIGYALATATGNMSGLVTWLFLLSVALWATSFLIGLGTIAGLYKAMQLSKYAIQERSTLPRNVALHTAFSELVEGKGGEISGRVKTFQNLQVILLMSGAITFIFVKVDLAPALEFLRNSQGQ